MTREESQKNGEELAKLLEERLQCKTDPLLLYIYGGSKVEGIIGKEAFKITVKRDEYLMISSKEMTTLESMKPTLVEYMGNVPICQYTQTFEKGVVATMEWDIQNPKDRITKIVNGKLKYPAENLALFGYNLEDFTNDEAKRKFEEAEAERIKNARIHGIDPGCMNPEEVEKMSECDLFCAIESLGYYLWWQRHEESHGRVEPVDLTEHQYGVSYLVNQTRKYGVELEDPQVDKSLAPTESYQKWYHFWKNWMNAFSDPEWREFEAKREKGEDISAYLPKKKWN